MRQSMTLPWGTCCAYRLYVHYMLSRGTQANHLGREGRAWRRMRQRAQQGIAYAGYLSLCIRGIFSMPKHTLRYDVA